jgi:ATP-dependent helicase/nuclease subunit A
LWEILENGFVEWGFSFRHESRGIRGQIDLWGPASGAIWVVDYKTGSSHHSAQAFQQLKAYAWALWKMAFIKSGDAVHLAVIYPFEEKIKLEKDLDLGGLEGGFRYPEL